MTNVFKTSRNHIILYVVISRICYSIQLYLLVKQNISIVETSEISFSLYTRVFNKYRIHCCVKQIKTSSFCVISIVRNCGTQQGLLVISHHISGKQSSFIPSKYYICCTFVILATLGTMGVHEHKWSIN